VFNSFFFLFSVSFLFFQIQTPIQIQTLWHFIYWIIIYFDHINCDEVIVMIILFVLNNIPFSSLFSRISFRFLNSFFGLNIFLVTKCIQK
jgi:hypothetical protein